MARIPSRPRRPIHRESSALLRPALSLTVFNGLTVTSTPATSATVGQTYTYTVQTNAPSGDTVTVNQIHGTLPTGMTFNATNTPSPGQPTRPGGHFVVSRRRSPIPRATARRIGPVSITVAAARRRAAPASIQFQPQTGQGTATLTSANNSSTADELQFLVSGVTAGATVNVYANGGTTAIATGTVATGATTITLTTDGNPSGTSPLADGSYTFTATQTVNSTASPSSSSISVQVFTALTAKMTSALAASATVGQAFSFTYPG